MLRSHFRFSCTTLGIGIAALLALTGCASSVETPKPSESPTTVTPTPSTPAGPQLYPDGTAADNLPLFDEITAQVWATEQRNQGGAYIDALVAGGFGLDSMQVTSDVSPLGHPVDTLLFSVRWGDEACLVGQVGPSTGEPITEVLPQLEEQRCIIGATVPVE